MTEHPTYVLIVQSLLEDSAALIHPGLGEGRELQAPEGRGLGCGIKFSPKLNRHLLHIVDNHGLRHEC